MPTTIEQIRKVNVYEEDTEGNRTLVQENVPLGSNVELKEKAPENSELSLLSGEKDVTANVIKLYPTAAKISSDGKINAKDLLIDGNSVKGKFISNVYWGEEKVDSKDVRRLYYNIGNNSFQVKDSEGNNSLNLLQVPYLELNSTNTIKTSSSTNPLCLNVDNVNLTKLATNTKAVLGHTAIKDSTLDLVDNTNGYLGARLGIDTREDKLYGYLSFYKTIKNENGSFKNYNIGGIFADANNSLCIMPRNIPYKDINTPETDEVLPVIAGSVGASQHKFEHMWAKNLHGNIQPVLYLDAPTSKTSLADLGFKDQLIYIGLDFGRSGNVVDMPFDSINGYCITLKTSDNENHNVIKQIFIRTGTKGTITERKIYLRTGYLEEDSTWSYSDWTPALGHTDWTEVPTLSNRYYGIIFENNHYIIPKRYVDSATILIQRRQFLDIYQSYDYINYFCMHRSINQIKKEIDTAVMSYQKNNYIACAAIETKCYAGGNAGGTKRVKVKFIFTYNDKNEICLVGIDISSGASVNLLRCKQYD